MARRKSPSILSKLLALLLQEPQRQASRQFFSRPLLTAAELKFFETLRRALPDFEVAPQVCMGALVAPPSHLYGEVKERARRRYQSKMIDFTVWDAKTGKVICLVELDDPSHDNRKEKDEERDAMTGEAGYATLRWDVRSLPTETTIREQVLACRPALSPASSTTRQSVGPTVVNVRAALCAGLVLCALLGATGWGISAAVRQFNGTLTRVVSNALPLTAVLLPGGDVKVTWPGCIRYQDAKATAAAQGRGCSAKEMTAFPRGLTDKSLEQWARFNRARLVESPGCPAYASWADEIYQQPASAAQRFSQLEPLYADALVKGCLRQPR